MIDFSKTADALHVANSIILLAEKEGRALTPMKLQKLIYFVYKKYYQDYDCPLFYEPFEVWQHGPVLQSVYNVFKEYGSNPIEEPYILNSSISYVDSKKFKTALTWVWERYKDYSGVILSKITHMDDTAWDAARKSLSPHLKDEDIKTEQWVLL